MKNNRFNRAKELLKRLVSTPSITKSEQLSAQLLYDEMILRGFSPERVKDNIICYNKHFSPEKRTLVLCSHHDTVSPNKGYTLDPFEPIEKDGRLYGLGSNDAGASLVALIELFDFLYSLENLPYNIALLITAQEESSGVEGMAIMFPRLHNPELVIVGEPTSMDIAVAERGLMVLDCVVEGIAGHAAHNNTVNPIIKAMDSIRWFSQYRFEKVSSMLGEVKMSVTVISAGQAHNVVPSQCNFTVDIRNNGEYTNQEILDIAKEHLDIKIIPRSVHLNPSTIELDHPFVEASIACGSNPYGSPTMSDQALIHCSSVKIGIGDSLRSHSADEYILLEELEQGIDKYIEIFSKYLGIDCCKEKS